MLSKYETYCKNKKPYWNYIVLSCYIFICALKIKDLSFISSILLVFAGFLVWTLNEYLLHRLLHLNGKVFKQLNYILHGVHHKYQNETNNFPFLHSLVLYGVYLFFALLIDQTIVYALFIGIFLGIFWLVYVHDQLHNPNSSKLITLKNHHAVHHKYSTFNFGTMTIFWDKIFGTLKLE